MTTMRLHGAGADTAALAQAALAQAALDRAVRRLVSLQLTDGRWQARPDPSVPAVAQVLLASTALGNRHPDADRAAAWIRAEQLPDGGWPGRAGGAAELSAAVLAYTALRAAGDSPDAYHMAVGAGWIRDAGGPGRAGVRARTWLALLGLWPWRDLAATGWPAGLRPAPGGTESPGAGLDLAELDLRPGIGADPIAERRSGGRLARWLLLAQRCGGAERIIAQQDPDGSWGGAALPTACSLSALSRLGVPPRDPAIGRGLRWLDGALPWAAAGQMAAVPAGRATGAGTMIADTALALIALAGAGRSADDASASGAAWLASKPAASTALDLRTASAVLIASRRCQVQDQQLRARLDQIAEAALGWLVSAQRPDGGWAGSARNREPGPGPGHWAASSSATAEAVAALAAAGRAASRPARRGVVWLLRAQRADGSWSDPGGQPETAVTAAAMRALIAAGVLPSKRPIAAAAAWLVRGQGEDDSWAGDPAVTALAVGALLDSHRAEAAAAAERGTGWLAAAYSAPAVTSPPQLGVLCGVITALGRSAGPGH